jgi:uncharacterized protein (DUF58 family)
MLKLFERRRQGTAAVSGPTATESVLNASTRVTLQELIELQRHARLLDITHRLPARAQLAGNHQSRFRGRGMDYLESRGYQPGDDIRNMDWRVTARAGRPHTKLFQEERERPVVLLIDLGPSMFFATRGALKSVIAARSATLLAWAAAISGDRTGALLFNGGHVELRPRSGHRGALQLIHELIRLSDPVHGLTTGPGHAGLNDALVRLRRIARPGSLVIMISDFYGIDDETGGHLAKLRYHNDLVAIRVTDPVELTPPPPGRYEITNGKQAAVLDITAARGRSVYNDFFSRQHQLVQQTLQRNAIPLLQLSTTDEPVQALQQWFGKARRSVQAKGGVK